MNARPIDPTDFVIKIDAPSTCYVDFDAEGDPGRTARLQHATKFSTENEARENLMAMCRQFPKRKFSAHRIADLPEEERHGR